MICVAGGTYLENCREPHWFELFGSGLRAACVLDQLGTATKLFTFVGQDQAPVLLAKSVQFEVKTEDIPSTIIFEYLHPLSKPVVAPDTALRELMRNPHQIAVEEELVIRFGFVEGNAKVKARMVVYDPQSPGDPRPFHENGSVAERLAIVANRSEAKRLSGISDPREASLALVAQGAEVAVVKCGANGCWVAHSGESYRVPAFRTQRVFPVGSGDVFTSLFALAWMERGVSPVEAATFASKGTSYYVESRSFPDWTVFDRTDFTALKPLDSVNRKKVYLASPFFNLSQRWLVEEFRYSLQEGGVRVFSPVHDVGRGDPAKIYSADIKGLKDAGVVLACLDGLDPGTIYEIGFAQALGIPVIALVSAERQEDLKMFIGGGCIIADDFASAFYLTVWTATCE